MIIQNVQQLLIEPLAEITTSLTYLDGQCLAHGGGSLSTLVPCPLATAPPFDSYPLHPSPPPQAQYTIYNDDINNHSFLRPGHLPHFYKRSVPVIFGGHNLPVLKIYATVCGPDMAVPGA